MRVSFILPFISFFLVGFDIQMKKIYISVMKLEGFVMRILILANNLISYKYLYYIS